MFYANSSKSHSEDSIVEVAKRILSGEKNLYLVACDTGTSGYDDLHIHQGVENEQQAIATSRSSFADYLDVSVETIESYEDSETNGWSFNVLTIDEINSLLNEVEI